MANEQTPVTPDTTVTTTATTPEPAKPAAPVTVVNNASGVSAASAASQHVESAHPELGEEEEPAEGQKYTFSSKSLKDRLSRHERKVLKDVFGTDDRDQIKQQLGHYKTLEKEREERRLAEMTELEREREKRKSLKREYKAFKRDVNLRETQSAVTEVETTVSGIAKDIIRDKSMRHAMRDFQDAVHKMSEEEADAFYNPESIKGWFEAYAKENEVGKVREAIEEPLTVGASGGNRPDPKKDLPGGKMDFSSKGGKSKKEVNETLKKMGLSVRI